MITMIDRLRSQYRAYKIIRHLSHRTPACLDEDVVWDYARAGEMLREASTTQNHIAQCRYCREEYRQAQELLQLQNATRDIPPLSPRGRIALQQYSQQSAVNRSLAIAVLVGFILGWFCWKDPTIGNLHILPDGCRFWIEILCYAFPMMCGISIMYLKIFLTCASWESGLKSLRSSIIRNWFYALVCSTVFGLIYRRMGLVEIQQPKNPDELFNSSNRLILISAGVSVIFCAVGALITGWGSRWFPNSKRQYQKRAERALNHTETLLNLFVRYGSPVALFAVSFMWGHEHDLNKVFPMFWFVAAVCCALCLHLCLVGMRIGLVRCWQLAKRCSPEIVFGLLFNSSYAILPRLYQSLHDRLGVRRDVAQKGICFAGVFSHDGTTIFLVMLVMWASGLENLSPIVCLLTVALFGSLSFLSPGTPHAGLVVGLAALGILKFKLDSIVAYMVFDLILSRLRTFGNLCGGLLLTLEHSGQFINPQGSGKKEALLPGMSSTRVGATSFLAPYDNRVVGELNVDKPAVA